MTKRSRPSRAQSLSRLHRGQVSLEAAHGGVIQPPPIANKRIGMEDVDEHVSPSDLDPRFNPLEREYSPEQDQIQIDQIARIEQAQSAVRALQGYI